MRAPSLVAAITMMHTVHASPRSDLAVRLEGVNDLSAEPHVFHHLDRNQQTASLNRERVNGDGDNEGGSPGAYVVKQLEARPEGVARRRVADRRFMRGPDYSQGGSGGDSDRSAKSSSSTMPTQKAEKAGETANSHT